MYGEHIYMEGKQIFLQIEISVGLGFFKERPIKYFKIFCTI